MAIELELRGVPYKQEVELPVSYKNQRLPCFYRADFVAWDDVIVELKALRTLGGTEESQIINYLKATGIRRGLLLNFGAPRLEYRRFVYDDYLCQSVSSVDRVSQNE